MTTQEYINKYGYCTFELGMAQGGDLVLQIDLNNDVYYASEYIDYGDGPVEDPEEICSSTSLDEIFEILKEMGYEV